MSLQVNNNAVTAEEPCWGRGLIIKQLGNLFSIIHVVLVTSGAGRGRFQKAAATLRITRRKFKFGAVMGTPLQGLRQGPAHWSCRGMLLHWASLGTKRNPPTLCRATRKEHWAVEDGACGGTSGSVPCRVPSGLTPCVCCQSPARLPKPPPLLFAPLMHARQAGIAHEPSRFPSFTPSPSAPEPSGPRSIAVREWQGLICAVLPNWRLRGHEGMDV